MTMTELNILQWVRYEGHENLDVSGSLVDLVVEIAKQQPDERMPPYLVVRDMLLRTLIPGARGGGLNWGKAIDLPEDTYIKALSLVSSEKLVPNCNSETYEEWVAWCLTQDLDVDYNKNLYFLKKIRDIKIEMDKGILSRQKEYLDLSDAHLKFLASEVERNRRKA